jgi:hypothetical protein
MRRLALAAVLLGLVLSFPAWSADADPGVTTAQGAVDKVEKDSVTIRSRGSDGRFGKNLTLKVTGTSKVSTLTTQMRSGKPVLVQKDIEVKELQPKQSIAVIYATGAADPVLLAAVVQPAADK